MSRTATSARGPWTLPEATLQKEMVRKSLAKPHPRKTLVWDQCAIEAISCGKCNGSALECCRLFPSLVQVLPIVVSRASATLVVCRRDQQCTVVHLCPFLAPADTTQGRGKQGKVDGQVGTRCIRQLSRLSGRHRASVGGTGPVPLRFWLSTPLLDMKQDAADRFVRDPIRCCHGTERFLLLHHTMHHRRPL
jgi:hypothetical protein